MRKNILTMFIVLVMLLLFHPVDVQAAPKINKQTITVTIGESYNLEIIGTKSNIKWSSLNNEVATVSRSGKVKGIGVGRTVINAKIGNKTYSCHVQVWPEDKNILLCEDDNVKLTYWNIINGNVYLKIYNKTGKLFSFTCTGLTLDKNAYKENLYYVDVLPKCTEMYSFNTNSDVDDIDKMSGSFEIFNKGVTIEKVEFRDIEIK